MPYYVSTKYAHLTLHCETRNRSDGGVTCQALIPDTVTALDWLGRVNGVWAPEYELLESEASMLHGEVWRGLSDECRQRLKVWCKLQPREVVKAYFTDADFGRRDAGLAGLVVTDQRILYCKYHRRGQVRLDTEEAFLFVRPHERFVSLTLVVGGERAKTVKLHRQDLKALQELLGGNKGLQLRISDPSNS